MFIPEEFNPIAEPEEMYIVVFADNVDCKTHRGDASFLMFNKPITGTLFQLATGEENEKVVFGDAYDIDSFIILLRNKKLKFSTVRRFIGQVQKQSEFPAFYGAYKAAFRSDVIGKAHSDRMRLCQTIVNLNNSISTSNLYGPLLTIVQSSGSGKSKLACSISDTFPCAYVVFRVTGDTGYPEKSKLSDLFSMCAHRASELYFEEPLTESVVGLFCLLIEAVMMDYLDRLTVLIKEHRENKTGKSASELGSMIMEEFIRGTLFGKNLEKFEKAQYKPVENYTQFQFNIKTLSNEISKIFKSDPSPQECPFVFIIDEAYLLSSTYDVNTARNELKCLRRAAHALGIYSNVVIVTLGTKSDYYYLNPDINTNSLRDKNRVNQFPAFVISRNTEIFSQELKAANIKVCPGLLKDPRAFLLLVAMGRPLWSSLFLGNVIQVAIAKLKNDSMKTGHTFVACWMLRTGIKSNPHIVECSRHLLKSIMATLYHITQDMKVMSVGYPSEPVLGIASREIVGQNLLAYYTALRDYLRIYYLDRGSIGEILVSDLCLQVMNKATKLDLVENAYQGDLPEFTECKRFLLEKHVENVDELCKEFGLSGKIEIKPLALELYKIVSVESFLVALLGVDIFRELVDGLISPDLKNGIINLNHFMNLNSNFPFDELLTVNQKKSLGNLDLPEAIKDEHAPDEIKNSICREVLQIGLKRQAGFMMPTGYFGIDMIVPVCLPGKFFNSNDSLFIYYDMF